MSALVLMGLLLVGAKPSKPPVSLPMPPPPAVKPRPPEPAPAPAPAPEPVAPAAEAKAPPPERPLLSKLRVSAGVGPGFSLQGQAAPNVSMPVWFRGSARVTLALARLGPGELQALLPIALQGAGFRQTFFGLLVVGSLFGVEVMPSARYQAEVFPDLSLFAELGLGYGFIQTTVQVPFQGYQTAGGGGFGIRVGAGMEYRLFDQLRILLQPMEVTSYSVTTTVTQGGTTVTTTSSASEWSMLVGAAVPL